MDHNSDSIDNRTPNNPYSNLNSYSKNHPNRIKDFDRAVRRERRSERDYGKRKVSHYGEMDIHNNHLNQQLLLKDNTYLKKKKKTNLQLNALKKAREIKKLNMNKLIKHLQDRKIEKEYIKESKFGKFTINKLKELLIKRNLPTTGRKFFLIKRLENK
jgi:hypothetical protein